MSALRYALGGTKVKKTMFAMAALCGLIAAAFILYGLSFLAGSPKDYGLALTMIGASAIQASACLAGCGLIARRSQQAARPLGRYSNRPGKRREAKGGGPDREKVLM